MQDDSDAVFESMQQLRELCPEIPVLRAVYRPTKLTKNKQEIFPVDHLRNQRVLAFCGIANPKSFRSSLEGAGAQIGSFMTFPDHYLYSVRDIESILKRAETEKAAMIVTTEKDGIKLATFPDFFQRIFLLCIRLDFFPEGELEKLIEARIRS